MKQTNILYITLTGDFTFIEKFFIWFNMPLLQWRCFYYMFHVEMIKQSGGSITKHITDLKEEFKDDVK